ncbi:recombinase family protein [Clostridium sp.]|uniref:recombinase family protein n=1 Tax=Clostridium sp. TaxID=1506 RepID=UPI0032163C0B
MEKRSAIIYTRVSTVEQASDGYSLANQSRECEEYCKMNNLEVIATFSDEGISGSSINKREGLKKALNLIKSNNVDYLIVWKLSRLSRSIGDISNIISLMEKRNTNLFSFKEKIDTGSAMGKPFIYISGIIAEIERDNTIVQVRAGMQQKALGGEWNGGKPPLGYNLEDKKLIVDKKESSIVEIIYKQYLANIGYKNIARYLNQNGHKTKKNNNFTGNAVKNILQNPIYAGKLRWGYRENWNTKNEEGHRSRRYNDNATIKDGIHEAIIDDSIFNKVQEMIKNNPRHHMRQFNGGHILSGLIRCPMCGGNMSMQNTTVKGKTYKYYSCNAYANNKGCKANQISKESIEEEFLNILGQIMSEDSFKEKMLSSLKDIDGQVQSLNKSIKKDEVEIKKLEEKQHKLVMKLADAEDYISEPIKVSLKKLKGDIDQLCDSTLSKKRKIENIKASNVTKGEIEEVLGNIDIIMKLMDKEVQNKLIRKLVNKIITGKDKHITEIHFRFKEKFIIKDGTVNRIISK